MFQSKSPVRLSAAAQDPRPQDQGINVAIEFPTIIELIALLIERAAEEATLGHGDGRDPIPMELMAGR